MRALALAIAAVAGVGGLRAPPAALPRGAPSLLASPAQLEQRTETEGLGLAASPQVRAPCPGRSLSLAADGPY